MAEDRSPKAAEEPAAASATTKQRKRRKWDQPAESLISAAAAAAGMPLGVGVLHGIPLLPGATVYPSAPLPCVAPATYAFPSNIASASLPQSAAATVQKLNQAKIQDELIAREIVINDAEPSIRYRLTKRQTQEEIQKSTGAVVITRGKYHPPNGPPDGEKPLYLHISAGSHLKDTAERIKAVDHAASMIEEILKQGQNLQVASIPFSSIQSNGQVAHPFSTCIFLGFDADPSLNIAARIRGPNDQYVSHIMNETGATVVLRGKDSGNLDSCHAEASQQPLHLYLSSMYAKSLEAAKTLAENLLDTIAAESGASRISSSKIYGAVPPPQQVLDGVQTSATVSAVHSSSGDSLPSISGSTAASFAPSEVSVSMDYSAYPPVTALQSGAQSYCSIQPNNMNYATPRVNGGTFYSGYGGIYPQATPLQQVALALRQGPSTSSLAISSTSSSASSPAKTSSSSNVETDKRPPQKRKFQELPVSKGATTENQNSQQGSEFFKTGSEDSGKRNGSYMPPPKNLVEPGSNGMLPPPPQNMLPPPPLPNRMPPPAPVPKRMPPPAPVPNRMPLPPSANMPPPPPKFTSHETSSKSESRNLKDNSMAPPRFSMTNTISSPMMSIEEKSDTLLKLVDYGEEDDDDDNDETEGVLQGNPTQSSGHKPFWAV